MNKEKSTTKVNVFIIFIMDGGGGNDHLQDISINVSRTFQDQRRKKTNLLSKVPIKNSIKIRV